MNTWQDWILAASKGTQLGGIARCALGRNEPGEFPAFVGKAIVTSDGFMMCDFVDREGSYHRGAFVCSIRDFERNVERIADHLKLSDDERAKWYAAAKAWIGMNYARWGINF